jgi:hypothetical protein
MKAPTTVRRSESFDVTFSISARIHSADAWKWDNCLQLVVQRIQAPKLPSANADPAELASMLAASLSTVTGLEDNEHGSKPQKLLKGAALLPPYDSDIPSSPEFSKLKFLGSSAQLLPAMQLEAAAGVSVSGTEFLEATKGFTLSYVASETGFLKAGGIRVYILKEDNSNGLCDAILLRKWISIAEVWASP